MNKNKITALLGAGVLTLGIVGGTLAWFTSQDEVKNIFNTGSVDNPDINAGIDVDEIFKGPDGTVVTPDENGNSIYPKPVLPGDKFTKEVWVDSEADYDQFVRARIEKQWKIGVAQTSTYGGPVLEAGAVVTHYAIVEGKVDGQKEQVVIYSATGTETAPAGVTWSPLDYSKIVLGFTDTNFGTTAKTNTWNAPSGFNTAWETSTTNVGEWYYYNQVLQEKGYNEVTGQPETDKTAYILESVTFKSEASNIDNVYKTLRFDVTIKAESIQASNGAAESSGWATENIPAASIAGYTK